MRPRRRARLVALFLALSVASGVCLPATSANVEGTVHGPRAFGYVIGDVLTESLTLDVPSAWTLDATTLPRRGRIGAWLEVRSVTSAATVRDLIRHYDIAVEYQIVNAPHELKTIALPSLTLGLTGPGGSRQYVAGDLPVNVAPLTTDLVRVGLDEMRPDVAPEPFPTGEARARWWRDTAVALLCLALFATLRFGRFGRPVARPFVQARADLERLRRTPDPAAFRTALRAVHRAFDATAARTVFVENVAPFLDARGIQGDLRERTVRFFAQSRAVFFEGGGDPPDASAAVQELIELCEAWQRIAGRRS